MIREAEQMGDDDQNRAVEFLPLSPFVQVLPGWI